MRKFDISISVESILETSGYKLRKLLGEGAFAKVYLTEYRSPGSKSQETPHLLACKLINVEKAPKDYVEKFLPRELSILLKVTHRDLIHVHSIIQRKLLYFVFMRYAENGDLLEFILKNGAISEGQSRAWMRQLCSGLLYLHRMEIAHRDLKCENCLLTENFNLKISDFGFARYVVNDLGRPVLSDTYCGSLSYIAPEVLKGTPYHPKIADCWSVGVILFIMVNTTMPFDDSNVQKLMKDQLEKRWRLRSRVERNVSNELKRVLVHLLDPEIKIRWTIDEVLSSEWMSQDTKHFQDWGLDQEVPQRPKHVKPTMKDINKMIKSYKKPNETSISLPNQVTSET